MKHPKLREYWYCEKANQRKKKSSIKSLRSMDNVYENYDCEKGGIKKGNNPNGAWQVGADLALHVHHCHCAGPVAHDELVRIPCHYVHRVHGDIRRDAAHRRLERIHALGGLDVPHLYDTDLLCSKYKLTYYCS